MSSSPASDFCRMLDTRQLPEKADVIIVLRNWDINKTNERLAKARELMAAGVAPVMMMSYDMNTKEEAERFLELMHDANWGRVVLVTHRDHSYRAFLTFAKVIGRGVDDGWAVIDPFYYKLWVASVPSLTDAQEFEKIQKYMAKGALASYEEGIQWLTSK